MFVRIACLGSCLGVLEEIKWPTDKREERTSYVRTYCQHDCGKRIRDGGYMSLKDKRERK